MSKKITIHHVTRIEGHARITIHLDDAGKVERTQFHVTQVRGFEKFVEGRPYYEMPAITARICGICPVSHLLASVKACDAIMAVRIPETAARLRELLHCAQIVQSHAISFFHLSSPDLLLGMDSDPARAQHRGPAREAPGRREGRHRAAEVRAAGDRADGGRAHAPVVDRAGRRQQAAVGRGARHDPLRAADREVDRPAHAASTSRGSSTTSRPRSPHFGTAPTMYAGLVDRAGPAAAVRRHPAVQGPVRRGGRGRRPIPCDYATYIGEAAVSDSYLKSPYFKPLGYPAGLYRVGPLARLNVADSCGTPEADAEFAEYHQRFGAHRRERLPLPLRAARRGHLRDRAHGAAARRTPRSSGPTSARTPT